MSNQLISSKPRYDTTITKILKNLFVSSITLPINLLLTSTLNEINDNAHNISLQNILKLRTIFRVTAQTYTKSN